jgi:hypothetical protein
VNLRFPHWHMHISSRLTDTEYAAGKALEAVRQRQNTHFDDCLHLAVSMRSFRAKCRLVGAARLRKATQVFARLTDALLSCGETQSGKQ